MVELSFTKQQLDEFLKQHSNELVGKVLARVESLDIKNQILKNLIKDTIHESHRDFAGKFIASLLGYKNFEIIVERPKEK
jgi:hypothetical protein